LLGNEKVEYWQREQAGALALPPDREAHDIEGGIQMSPSKLREERHDSIGDELDHQRLRPRNMALLWSLMALGSTAAINMALLTELSCRRT